MKSGLEISKQADGYRWSSSAHPIPIRASGDPRRCIATTRETSLRRLPGSGSARYDRIGFPSNASEAGSPEHRHPVHRFLTCKGGPRFFGPCSVGTRWPESLANARQEIARRRWRGSFAPGKRGADAVVAGTRSACQRVGQRRSGGRSRGGSHERDQTATYSERN